MSDTPPSYVREPVAVVRAGDEELWQVDRFVKPPKPSGLPNRMRTVAQVVAVAGVLLASLGCFLVAAVFVWPRIHASPQALTPDLNVALVYPRYVTVGDGGQVDMTVINIGHRPLTATVTLVFTGTPAAQVLPDSSNTLVLKGLASGAQQTAWVRFQLHQSPRPFHIGRVSLFLRADVGGQVTDSPHLRDSSGPVPLPASPGDWLSGSRRPRWAALGADQKVVVSIGLVDV